MEILNFCNGIMSPIVDRIMNQNKYYYELYGQTVVIIFFSCNYNYFLYVVILFAKASRYSVIVSILDVWGD